MAQAHPLPEKGGPTAALAALAADTVHDDLDEAALIEKMVMAMESLPDAAALAEATTANREERTP